MSETPAPYGEHSDWLTLPSRLHLLLLNDRGTLSRAEREAVKEARDVLSAPPLPERELRDIATTALLLNDWLLAELKGIAEMPEYDQDDAHRLRAKARAAIAPAVEVAG